MTEEVDDVYMSTFDGSLMHYGILRRSGRYPWGSGGDTVTRSRTFLDYIKNLLGMGMSEVDIAKSLSTDDYPFTTTDLRAIKIIAKAQVKAADIAFAQRLKDKGVGTTEIGRRMGINESSVRALLAPGARDRSDKLAGIADMLRNELSSKQVIDVGGGVETHLGISADRLKVAIALLKEEGYTTFPYQIEQLGTAAGQKTRSIAVAAPGVTYRDVVSGKVPVDNLDAIKQYSRDNGKSFLTISKPLDLDPKRLQVVYGDEGGADADGMVYVRPGVPDLTLGKSHYAQVRISVNGTHYIKGMAIYKDDLPPGVDLQFNTPKNNTGNKLDALKPLKDDPENPFGSIVRQLPKLDHNGNEIDGTVRSVMNLVNEEGDWDKWSKNISSQVLSKQSIKLAKNQLDMTYERQKNDLDEIMALTNPLVRRKLLESFADGADAAAVRLKAASLPSQRSQVLLPVKSLKETEVFAPNFKQGERVVLVRYPHGGPFEIPELTVTHRNPEARRVITTKAQDAIGINPEVAKRLSGADFDGDTVLVIPNGTGAIRTQKALEGLKDFDPARAYPKYPGMKVMSEAYKQRQMGEVSNLITDMTIQGATPNEVAAAVRHSMVVIDAVKKELNYKQSAIDNNIAHLKERYQKDPNTGSVGAATLISRAKSEIRVPHRRLRKASEGGPVDPKTGKKVYVDTDESYVDSKTGKTIRRTSTVRKLDYVDDARKLSSGTPMESVYATHSNRLKSLANKARLEAVRTPSVKASPSAKKAYSKEVAEIDAILAIAYKNRPLERNAQTIAKARIQMKRQANPDMSKDELKKLRALALADARRSTGAKKQAFVITDKQWEAIQAGAITAHKLSNLLNYADLDQVRALATPKTRLLMSSSKINVAKAMIAKGYTQAEIAQHLGVSLTTLKEGLK